MVTRIVHLSLIREVAVKVAICTPFEAAQIVESTATPNKKLVGELERKGTCVRKICPAQDPDRAAWLMWLGDTTSDVIKMVVSVAQVVDNMIEEIRNSPLNIYIWLKEVEPRYKCETFINIINAFGIELPKFEKTKGEFTFDLLVNNEDQEISINVEILKNDSEARILEGCYGRLSHKYRESPYKILINEEKSISDGLDLTWVLYHEVIHLKQRVLRSLDMEVELPGKDSYQMSPFGDSVYTRVLFRKALKCLM